MASVDGDELHDGVIRAGVFAVFGPDSPEALLALDEEERSGSRERLVEREVAVGPLEALGDGDPGREDLHQSIRSRM